MDWFSTGLDCLSLAAQGSLHLWFSGRLTGKKVSVFCFPAYLTVLFAFSWVLKNHQLSLWGLAVLYGINRFWIHNSYAVSGLAAILAISIPQLVFGILDSLVSLIFPHFLENTGFLSCLAACATLAALLTSGFCCAEIAQHFPIRDASPETWLFLPSCIFLWGTELFLVQTAYWKPVSFPGFPDPQKQAALFAWQMLGLVALLSTLYLEQRVRESFRTKTALASLEQENHAQKTYVAQAQARYEQTRAFRHDMKNHLSILDGLLKTGDWKQAQNYLQKLDIFTKELSFPVQTGRPVLDILLSDKLERARTAQIQTELSLVLPPLCDAVDDFDLCVLFANALDNAIAACEKVPGARQIQIVGKQQGNFYLIEFGNTCWNNTPLRMGTGLSNIRTAAEKYAGTITIQKTNRWFRLDVLLNLSEDSEHPVEYLNSPDR